MSVQLGYKPGYYFVIIVIIVILCNHIKINDFLSIYMNISKVYIYFCHCVNNQIDL